MYCKYSQPLLNTLLKRLWQQLQPEVFLSMMLGTPIFGEFLPFFFAGPLKGVLQVPFGKLHTGSQVPFTEEWLPFGHSTIKA